MRNEQLSEFVISGKRMMSVLMSGFLFLQINSFNVLYAQSDTIRMDDYYFSYSNLKLSDSLQLWATYYYIPVVKYDETGLPLLNGEEKEIGLKLSPEDWCKAAIEGTVHIQKDSNLFLLNYEDRSKKLQYDCRKCEKYKNYDNYLNTGKVLWSKTSGFGKGVEDYRLIPFRSIAVDKSIIPYGSVLFIPEAKGVTFTDSDGIVKTHDGLFLAADAGSKITGDHIDVLQDLSPGNPFGFIKSSKRDVFKSYIVIC